MHPLGRRGFFAGATLAVLEAAQLSLGCESTTGARVVIESRVRGDVARDEAFVTDLGFSIELARAELAIEHLVYLEGAPIAAVMGLVPAAYAHPGHYAEGRVIGEMTHPRRVDLLAGETRLGTGDGVTGQMRSAAVSFIDDEVVVALEGRASLGADTVTFEASLSAADLASTEDGLPVVRGCPVEDGEVASDGVVSLEVAVRLWLDQIDFAPLMQSAEPLMLAQGEPPHNALARGAKKAASYRFTFEKA